MKTILHPEKSEDEIFEKKVKDIFHNSKIIYEITR
jgi:hypothetical protein